MGVLTYFGAAIDRSSIPGSKVDGILINVPQNASDEGQLKETGRLLEKAQPKCLCQDSGGFQLLKAEENNEEIYSDPTQPVNIASQKEGKRAINLTPEHIVWSARMLLQLIESLGLQIFMIMMSLDFPTPENISKSAEEFQFRLKLPVNLDWARRTSHLHQKHGLNAKLFIPVQCYNMRQLDIFLRGIEGIRHDGLSVPVRGLSIFGLAEYLVRMCETGIKMIHILGTGMYGPIALAAYLARNHCDWVSLDATSWFQAAMSHDFLMPDTLKAIPMTDNITFSDDYNPCLCPWCSETKSLSYIKNLPRYPFDERFQHLCRHNFWVTTTLCRNLFTHADDLGKFEARILSTNKPSAKIDELLTALQYLDYYVNQQTSREEAHEAL
ncbi:MAG: hypothetical protein ABSB95_01020 [Dissulfurispiraceae bacterium]|jgi:tRNA-guanine family transglycosylase